MINVLQPSCTEAEIAAVSDVLRSGWWGEGPKVAEFERRLAARYGKRHAVAVNSCTAALHLALLSHGVGPGDEVIVPALTFVSTALAVVYCGARPIFADVKPDSLTLDWEQVKRHGRSQTKAIIPVDYAGYPVSAAPMPLNTWCDLIPGDSPGAVGKIMPMPEWAIVQDAAHSCGGLAYGDSTCLSFHPVKNLATGDGGAILLDDDERAERLRALRWCGIDRSTWRRTGKRYAWDYDIAEIGYKCHWNDVQAAIGLIQLDRLDAMNARRRAIAENYTRELGYLVQIPLDHPAHTWHIYVIRVDADRRDGVLDYLALKGIAAGVHYKPLTYYPMFASQPTPPVTEREWRRLISLPIHVDLTDDEQGQVIAAVKEALR
jgi:perosamine synthetase